MFPTLRLVKLKRYFEETGRIEFVDSWFFKLNKDQEDPYDTKDGLQSIKINKTPDKQVVICPVCSGRADNLYPVILRPSDDDKCTALMTIVQLHDKRYYYDLDCKEKISMIEINDIVVYLGLCHSCIIGYGSQFNKTLASKLHLTWPELLTIPYNYISNIIKDVL